MAPSSEEFRKIAEEAERNLNTYEAKTGAHKTSPSDEAGVDRRVENQFPGGQVRYDQDLSTNAGYNKRIPPEEGGDLDARGRQTRGEHFEGVGGPEHKLERQMRDFGGNDELDLTDKRGHDFSSKSHEDDTTAVRSGEVMAEGKRAVQANIAEGSVRRTHPFPGSEYHTPREAPADMSAEGYEAPPSVTEASPESARRNG
ncbi:hypothetical protein F5Y01DRAFT_296703 [Xylaria sp. FL0043]|nr:hypothetical protein F5Y01DRAFT_296703 [Xylaria sp. FL0043]